MKRFFYLVLAALALSGASGHLPIHNVKPGDAEKLLAEGGVLLLDIRTPEEFQAGHIPSARPCPLLGFSKHLKELPSDKTQPVLIYDATGARSFQAAKVLAEHGYKDLYSLSGGIRAWTAEQKAIEKPSR
jgi:rhodanese-related sulfurtransferase